MSACPGQNDENEQKLPLLNWILFSAHFFEGKERFQSRFKMSKKSYVSDLVNFLRHFPLSPTRCLQINSLHMTKTFLELYVMDFLFQLRYNYDSRLQNFRNWNFLVTQHSFPRDHLQFGENNGTGNYLESHPVAVTGRFQPRPCRNFVRIGFPQQIISIMNSVNFDQLTPIQSQKMAIWQTCPSASYKMCAFPIPSLAHKLNNKDKPRDIVCPIRSV